VPPPAPPYGAAPPPAPPYGAPPPGYGPPPAYGEAPPAYGAAPYPAYATVPQSGFEGFAIASIICAFVCSPLGIIFGAVALRRIKRTGKGGHGLALAGLILSILFLVAGGALVAVGIAGSAHRSSSGAITSSGKIAVTDLRVGDCLNFPAAGVTSVRAFDAVPCSQPHDAEAYASGTLPLTGSAYPGTDAVTKATESQCSTAFQPFVGVGIDSSALEVSYFYPQPDSWGQGDRGYVCVVGASGAKTTGTLKGAAR
jgi:hypothetical protein